jgi:hypothetical protein
MDVRIETRVFEEERRYRSDARTLWVPFEISLRFPLSSDDSVAIQSAKVSAMRLLHDTYGITVDFLGFAMKRYDSNIGTFAGVNVGSATLNQLIQLNDSGSVEFVVKGSATLELGNKVSIAHPLSDQIKDAVRAGGGSLEELNSGFGGGSLTGAVGFRFHKRVLVDLFGGIERSSFAFAETRVQRGYYGAGLRIVITPSLHLRGTIEQNYYKLNIAYSSPERDTVVRGSATERPTVGKMFLEYRW